jgi:hypothetical protein
MNFRFHVLTRFQLVDIDLHSDVPPNSLRNPNVGPITKQRKNKRIGARFLTCNTSRVGRCVGILGWDYDEFTSKSSK